MVKRKWTVEETIAALDAIIATNGDGERHRVQLKIAEDMNRGGCVDMRGRVNPDLVWRKIWGIAVRLTEYTLLDLNGVVRPNRTGLPFTATEIFLIKTAVSNRSEEAKNRQKVNNVGPPNKLYMAVVLARSIDDFGVVWDKYGPAQGRGAGFGLVNET